MNAPPRFKFAAPTLLSLADVQRLAVTDPRIPATRRAGVLSSLSRFPTWVGQDASAIVFVEPVIEGSFNRLRADVLGVSNKRLQNARSDIRFVLGLYGGPSRYLAPFTPAAQRLWDMLNTKYERCSLSRLLRFLSAQGIDPENINEQVSQQFLEALRKDARLRLKPEIFHQSAIRAWNKAVLAYQNWPQATLSVPRYKQTWAKPWTHFLPTLEQDVDCFLARGAAASALFDETRESILARATRRTQKQHFRAVASALVNAHIPAERLTSVCCLCTPDRIKTAIRWIVRERGDHVGGYVEGIMWTLVRAARSAGMLSISQIGEVDKLCADLSARRKADRRTHRDRDQALLTQLDAPNVMDALLCLPTRTVERVLKSGERSIAAALNIQRALALELWLCASLRLANFVRLRLDTHIHRMRLDGRDMVAVEVPAEEVKNRQALEHFLNKDTKDLLELYVREFRPLLVSGPSPWLFPGRRGRAKAAAAFSTQMKRFVHDAVGIDFHPHLVRKIAVKILLDADPAQIEIARRHLGHTHASTTRQSYTQHQQRAAQHRYLAVLEGRRLTALHQGIVMEKDHV